MKAQLANEQCSKPTTMRDMQPGDLAITTGGYCKGQIVWRVPDNNFRIQSLTAKDTYWDCPNSNPVYILKSGEQVILTQE